MSRVRLGTRGISYDLTKEYLCVRATQHIPKNTPLFIDITTYNATPLKKRATRGRLGYALDAIRKGRKGFACIVMRDMFEHPYVIDRTIHGVIHPDAQALFNR